MVAKATFTSLIHIRQLREVRHSLKATCVKASGRFTHITRPHCVTNVPKTCTSTTSQTIVVALSLRCGQGSALGVGNLGSVRRNSEWAISDRFSLRMTILRWHVMQGRERARTGCCMDDLHVARGRLARGSSYGQGYHLRRRTQRGGSSIVPAWLSCRACAPARVLAK